MNSIEIPVESRIRTSLPGAYFHDSFEVVTKGSSQPVLEIYLDVVAHTPPWVNFLMRLRNRCVAIFGLKNLGGLGDVDTRKGAGCYKVGERVGIFSILSLTDQEVVLGDSDKHLDVQVSICKHRDNPQKITVTTVVHTHNFLGKVYMFFVIPAHKRIVPATLRCLSR